MFQSARLKLTLWYTVIIMAISLLFSVAIYRVLTFEIARSLRIQRYRMEHPNIFFNGPPSLFIPTDPDIVAEITSRIRLNLLLINLGILAVSGASGYFLAGRTLKPIEDMVEEQKRFIADASHELRTPLTAIKTETEVALRDSKMDIKVAKKLLESNLEEVAKMQTLSNYLLILNQYQNSQVKHPFALIKLKSILQKAEAKISPLATKKKVNIKIEGKDLDIEGNDISLTELFSILLDNAVKYSHYGEKVIARIKKEGKNAVVEVEDFGIGIKAGDIPYIFNRFYRADTSRSKERVDGYGLGLSIAKSIVDFYHGKIEVASIPDKGSSFTISLPLKQ